MFFRTLTEQQKREIRQRAIREIKIDNTKKMVAFIASIVVTVSLIMIALNFIKLN